MTYTVETPRSKKRRLRWPKLPLAERQLAWTGRALLLLLPVLAFALVEYLNYNSWDDFTPVQIALNLAWYYLIAGAVHLLAGRTVLAAGLSPALHRGPDASGLFFSAGTILRAGC